MSRIITYFKTAGLAATLACGTAIFTNSAQAHGTTVRGHHFSHAAIRSAQQQLKTDGYYTGPIDGVYGPMTQAAIKKYQSDKNLTVTGRLDKQTRGDLGMSTSGQASRSATETGAMSSSATVSAAQRAMQQKGFYSGSIDGKMTSETRSAIREYQKNSNLNVTGDLDQGTLSSLGVSK